jgi:hypothetical protein
VRELPSDPVTFLYIDIGARRSAGEHGGSRVKRALLATRRTTRRVPAAKATSPARASPMTFVWTQVRQALQQTAAMGAWSPYFPAAWASLPVAKAFTSGAYLSRRSGLLRAAKQPAEMLCCVECGAREQAGSCGRAT